MAAAAGMSMVGGMMGAFGAIEAGDQQAHADFFRAEEANKAAITAEDNARLTLEQSLADQVASGRASNLVIGDIRAAYGASGVTMDGTPQAYLEMNAANAAANRQTIVYEGDLKAKAFRDSATSYRSQANQFLIAMQNAKKSAGLNAAGAALGAGGQIASRADYSSRATTLEAPVESFSRPTGYGFPR